MQQRNIGGRSTIVPLCSPPASCREIHVDVLLFCHHVSLPQAAEKSSWMFYPCSTMFPSRKLQRNQRGCSTLVPPCSPPASCREIHVDVLPLFHHVPLPHAAEKSYSCSTMLPLRKLQRNPAIFFRPPHTLAWMPAMKPLISKSRARE
ncbi:hypothetical protein PoB_004489300 [Plakobranchus ocellatus]|uniref:Uncharacterized protein n=1 Tax=Plakobranchus ocellatus TaxID=259542 RepID=A0AAV4BHU4_9GAST|nr:hypothetical protein PoB_004489300 [Plakobranchus ocellatus]